MSDLLEKAIIDAKVLREVATKNAESQIIEKYSREIKEAVEKILERDDDMSDTKEDVMDIGGEEGVSGMDGEMESPLGSTSSEETPLSDSIPLAAMEGEKGVPGEDEEIEIDFSELEKQLGAEKDLDASDMTDREEIASDLPTTEPISTEPTEEISSIEEPPQEEVDEYKEEDLYEDGLDGLDEETLKEIVEALEIDYEAKPNGWYGSTEVERKEALEGTVAKSQESDPEEVEDEKKKELETTIKGLGEEVKTLKEQKVSLVKENKELKDNIKNIVSKLNESNIVNAKLLYTNKILKNISLNEKQKNIFVEEISRSDSVDKAKVIYEALINSMGVDRLKKSPKSLNEVVSRPLTTFPFKPNQEKVISDPLLERMRTLAGIK